MKRKGDTITDTTTDTDTDTEIKTKTGKMEEEETKCTIVYNKKNIEVSVKLESWTVGDLKQAVAKETNVPTNFQKIMVKGMMLKDDSKPLKDVKTLKKGVKILLIGCSVDEVKEVNDPSAAKKAAITMSRENEALAAKAAKAAGLPENFQDESPHKEIIAAGVPEKALPGVANRHDPLPTESITGIVNSKGESMRISFSPFAQELTLKTASSTEKVFFHSITRVYSVPIKGKEEYSVVALKLGEQKKLFFMYWVPSQYVNAIKATIGMKY